MSKKYLHPEDTIGEGESENQDGESVEEGGVGDGDLEKRMRKALAQRMTYTSTTEMGYWGDMTIVKPPLPVNLTARLKLVELTGLLILVTIQNILTDFVLTKRYSNKNKQY